MRRRPIYTKPIRSISDLVPKDPYFGARSLAMVVMCNDFMTELEAWVKPILGEKNEEKAVCIRIIDF